jgi:hypothetical protein
VTVDCVNGPPGSSCENLPATVDLKGKAEVKSGVQFAKTTPAGAYTITFTVTAGSIEATANLEVTVAQ